MSARNSRFGAFGSRSARGNAAGAVIACAVMLLAGCGGSGGSAADAGAPVIRGDAFCEPAKDSWIVTAAARGVTRTVIFTAPTYISPWTTFEAMANTGQHATISTSSSIGSIQVRGLMKGANTTFTVTGTTANGCWYPSKSATTP